MVHSNTKNILSRVFQSQVCYLLTTHSSTLKHQKKCCWILQKNNASWKENPHFHIHFLNIMKWENYPCYYKMYFMFLQVGHSFISRVGHRHGNSYQDTSSLQLLHHSLLPLESLIKCIEMNWMAILVSLQLLHLFVYSLYFQLGLWTLPVSGSTWIYFYHFHSHLGI